MAMTEEADNAAEMDAAMNPPHRPFPDRRKSSFSDTLNKFATNTFSRRRTTVVANIPTSSTALSHLPTTSGIARSTSFFSGLNAFSSKTHASGSALVSSTSLASFPNSDLTKVENQKPSSKPGRLSTRIAQTPFFTRQTSAPITPQHNHQPRESGVHIIQHQLMAPLGPPVPRRKTLGDLQGDLASATSSPRTPSYARTTSSSENRRKATLGAFKENQVLTPTHGAAKKTPTTTSSTKARSGTPHPKRTPALTSSGRSYLPVPVRAAPKAKETPSPTPDDVPEPKSAAKARVSFSNADEVLIPITAGPLEFQAEPEVEEPEFEESETPTPTPGSSFSPVIAALRQQLEAAKLAPVPEKLEPAEAQTKEEVVAVEEGGSRAATPIPQNPRHIFTAMPPGYWAGRLSALSDRFRTEEMNDSSSFFRAGSMHDDERRTRRVFVHLNSLCQTEVARESLAAFKAKYEKRVEDEEGMEGGKVVSGKGKGKVGVKKTVQEEKDDEEDGDEGEGQGVLVGQQMVGKKKGGFLGKLGKGGKKGRKKSGGW